MNSIKKRELIESVAHALDITPDMYNHSESIVREITEYLKNIDPGLSVYKQGSFKIGTVIKPYKKDRKGAFDVDLVVEFNDDKNITKPDEIKTKLGKFLKNNYSSYLEEEGRRCWTLNYPNKITTGSISFHIDLLPCVSESEDEKEKIKPNIYKDTAVAITEIINKQIKPYTYKWKTSNPKGFAEWFDGVNYGKYKIIKHNDRKRIFESYKNLFDSIEAVRDDYTRSPLQMVIQILKRHRDVMYANTNQERYKPISIIITTLIGKIVEENHITINNTYELLNTVLKGLDYYASLQNTGITSDFSEEFKTKQLIHKSIVDGKIKWTIKNPANSDENLADKWCEDSSYAIEFFRWVKQAQNDLIDILEFEPKDIILKFKYCLGEDIANLLESFDFSETPIPQPFAQNIIYPKPYKV